MPETDAIEPGNTWSYAEKQFAIAFNKLLSRQSRILTKLEAIMATLDDLVAAAENEDTKLDSLIALTVEIKRKLDEALAGVLTPEQQAKVDAVFAAISDNPQRIQDAIDANTPSS